MPQAVERTPIASEATAPALEAGSGLRLRVWTAAGEPARGARIAAMELGPPGPRMIGYYEPDEHGEVQVPDWRMEQSAQRPFVLACPDHAPLTFFAQPVDGVHAVRLTQEVALAGTVSVNGAPPAEPGLVRVSGFRDPAQALPAYAREILAQWGLGDGTTQFRFGPAGSFVLYGVPAGEVVELTFSDDFLLRDDPTRAHPARVRVTTPALHLTIDLVRLPVIRGTLQRRQEPPQAAVSLDTGFQLFPFPQPWFGLEWTLYTGEASVDGGVAAHVGHEFRIPISSLNLTRAQLRVRDSGGTLIGMREVPGPISSDVDLGEWIVPDPERRLLLRVLDDRRAPVANALVVAHKAVQGRTDAEGCLALNFHVPTETLTVGAYGYRLQRLTLPDPPPAEWMIMLEPACRLRLEVVEPDGSPSHSAVAVFSLGGPIVEDSPEAVAGFSEVRGPPAGGGIWSQGWHELHYPVLGLPLEWSDLPVAVPFQLELRDVYDELLHQQELILGPGELRVVRVTTPRASRSLAGRVVAPSGEPISGATVFLGGMFREVNTDADGNFAFHASYAEAPSLWIHADGWVARTIEAAEWAPDQNWQLEPARTVWIECRDASGARVDAGLGPLLEVDGGWRGAGTRRGPGLYEVTGVPRRTGQVSIPDLPVVPTPLGADQTEILITVP